MSSLVVVIGAGMGGLTASIRLAQHGFRVRVMEAADHPGGFASGFEKDSLRFDAGPYILLDRNGLDWAFRSVGLDLSDQISLRRIQEGYQVEWPDGISVNVCADLEETAQKMDTKWPGSGKKYDQFIRSTAKIYERLQPLLYTSHPGPSDLLTSGAWKHAGFLLKSLASVLAETGLPQPVQDAISIWTHVAGQRVDEAPSPLAFLPALIHTVGGYYPVDGMASIPRALERAAVDAGVEFSYRTKVKSIRCHGGRVREIETDAGEHLPVDAVVSNSHGVGTYVELLETTPKALQSELEELPLQSPGVCAYLAVKGTTSPPYLRFQLPGSGELCRLLISPSVVAPEVERDGWCPARLLAPMRHAEAERLGAEGQREFLERVLAGDWWRRYIDEFRIVATRVPADWGRAFRLYRDSMNPVMTAHLMRKGRLSHRSPHVKGLYLAGSSTHPGQWISFCAISGVLAADRLVEDFT